MAAAAAAAISPCHRTLFFSSATRDGTHRRPISDKDDHLPTAAVISSPSNPFVKHCVKLRLSSSYRHSSGSALVVGLAPITEISRFQESSRRADGSSGLIECLLLLDGAEAPSGGSSRIVRVSSAVMKKVSGLKSVDSTEAIAVMRIPPSFCSLGDGVGGCLSWLPCSPRRLLVLDGIQVLVFRLQTVILLLSFGWLVFSYCSMLFLPIACSHYHSVISIPCKASTA